MFSMLLVALLPWFMLGSTNLLLSFSTPLFSKDYKVRFFDKSDGLKAILFLFLDKLVEFCT